MIKKITFILFFIIFLSVESHAEVFGWTKDLQVTWTRIQKFQHSFWASSDDITKYLTTHDASYIDFGSPQSMYSIGFYCGRDKFSLSVNATSRTFQTEPSLKAWQKNPTNDQLIKF